MKKFLAFTFALILLVCLSSTAAATDPPETYSSIPTEGTPATDGIGSGEGTLVYALGSAAAEEYTGITVYTWRNRISEISPGYLKCYCYTTTDVVADMIGNDYVLQQWNGSSWITYSTSSNSIRNNSQFMCNIYRYVAHGYYYRIKTTHRAWLDLYYNQQVLYSSYIYVE